MSLVNMVKEKYELRHLNSQQQNHKSDLKDLMCALKIFISSSPRVKIAESQM